jgi:UDP-N-acetylmuramoyl-tripeptide--D-alanyl-D-alanine ligase
MGAGKPGDIAYLTEIARPDVSLVNNIAPAHLERMGSLLGIAGTKGAIYDALPADGVAVVNADDDFAAYFIERVADRRVLRFGLDTSRRRAGARHRLDADGARFVLAAPGGDIAIELRAAGSPQRAQCARGGGDGPRGGCQSRCRSRAGLEAAAARSPAAWSRIALRNGALLIDDSYNANPGSLARGASTRFANGGEAWLVLGDMRELGADEIALHARGRAAGQGGRHRPSVRAGRAERPCRRAAFGDGAQPFDSHLIVALAELRWAAGKRVLACACLVKGSRGSAMDRVVKALLQRDAAENGGGTTDAA